MYGTSPAGFAPCGRMAFFGALGPEGTLASGVEGRLVAVGLFGEAPALCEAGENLEDMLDNHEFRLDVVPGEGVLDTPFTAAPLSVEEPLLENPGRAGIDIGFGDEDLPLACSPFWFSVEISVFSTCVAWELGDFGV